MWLRKILHLKPLKHGKIIIGMQATLNNFIPVESHFVQIHKAQFGADEDWKGRSLTAQAYGSGEEIRNHDLDILEANPATDDDKVEIILGWSVQICPDYSYSFMVSCAT